jgi:hypothetical protein
MPNLKGKKQWTESEIVVLCAIFASAGFSAGDDERPECKAIAHEFGRSPGTVDRQWRNIKDYLAGYESQKVGRAVKIYTDHTLNNPLVIKKLAKYYCRLYSWNLENLINES